MRRTSILAAFCVALLAAACASAGLPITTLVGDPSPTTSPAAPTSVMLLPFHAVSQNPDDSWISQAIDEDLSHDLSRNRAIRLIRPPTTQPISSATTQPTGQPVDNGLAAARDAGADRLITGSYQVVNDQLRIDAELIDLNQTQPLAEAKATGRVRDLFQLEDSVAMQLWHSLPQSADDANATDFTVTPLEDYVASQQSAPPVVYVPQSSDVSSVPVYQEPYDDAYPYAGYGYGYPYGLGVPLFFYGGGYRYHGGYHGGEYHGHYGGGASHTGTIVHGAAPAFSGGGARFSGGGSQFGAGGRR